MKELYNKNKKLIWTGLTISILVIALGVSTIISEVNKRKIAKDTNIAEISEYTEPIKGYDVSGLTQEEIEEYLSIIRESEGNN